MSSVLPPSVRSFSALIFLTQHIYLPFPSDLIFISIGEKNLGRDLTINFSWTRRPKHHQNCIYVCFSLDIRQASWHLMPLSDGFRKIMVFVDYPPISCEFETHIFSAFLNLKWKLIILMFSFNNTEPIPKASQIIVLRLPADVEMRQHGPQSFRRHW